MGLMIPQKRMGKGNPRRDAKGACYQKEHDEDPEKIQDSHKETIGMWGRSIDPWETGLIEGSRRTMKWEDFEVARIP